MQAAVGIEHASSRQMNRTHPDRTVAHLKGGGEPLTNGLCKHLLGVGQLAMEATLLPNKLQCKVVRAQVCMLQEAHEFLHNAPQQVNICPADHVGIHMLMCSAASAKAKQKT